ncbi:hypothetical protein [Chryseolinea soli]|uniref:G-D-S-L family lipolytic protein n=1 Tax=Chryseolinea soli TaxID=2321403 RepID=A0A385SSR1_9BACT|nr:hypothetical protein [Chryseolinea soli]AYB33361.1 hypothetical protein D4L85_23465 [Chryseolinea soli]
MRNSRKYFALAFGMMAGACTYDFPETAEPTAGEADFTKMISVGSGLSTGFMNGALYTAGQDASFVRILAQQMQAVGGGTFTQPDVASENGCYNPAANCTAGRLYLKINPTTGSPGPTPKPGDGGKALAPYSGSANLNNFAVPATTLLLSLIPQTGGPAVPQNPAYNPYYGRIASIPSVSTIIGDAAKAFGNGGTFLTFWLGNDDVLGYATAGASAAVPLTTNDDFNTRYNTALNTMLSASANAKGVVANIPDVTSLPFFSTVAYNPIPLDAATAAYLTSQLAVNYNAFLDAMVANQIITADEAAYRKLTYIAGNNPILINDETLTNLEPYMAGPYAGLKPYAIARQTKFDAIDPTKRDYVCLTAGSYIGANLGANGVNGVSAPLTNTSSANAQALKGDDLILIPQEITQIQASISAFNGIIKTAVDAHADRLAFVDANAILASLKTNGARVNGATITASISPPFGGFGLDGVYPNARGNGYLANAFITAINAKFKSGIPLCNPNNFAGNELPVQ